MMIIYVACIKINLHTKRSMIKYKDGYNILSINNKFTNQGVLVNMRHNKKLYRLLVSDKILADNITHDTYEDFRRLSTLKKERVNTNDFVLPKPSNSNNSTGLINNNISSFIDTFKRLKTWHAYLCMLILSQDLCYDVVSDNPRDYVLDVAKCIASTPGNDEVIRKLANRTYEELQTLNKYFSDKQIAVRFNINLPLTPEYVIISNGYVNFVVFFVLVIVILIIWYYLRYRKHESKYDGQDVSDLHK